MSGTREEWEAIELEKGRDRTVAGQASRAITLNEARVSLGLPPEGVEVLSAEISGEEMAQASSLLEAAVNGPDEGRVERIRELMRYSREVLSVLEPEQEPPC